MADVWKSQGRKFCTICKVWFGDNRASIEFHERGKKHKDALAAKLRDLGRAAHEKEQAQWKMNTALAAMEAAALKAMKENGEGIEHGPALPSTGLSSKIFDPRQMKDVSSMAREMAKRKNELLEMKNKKRHPPPAPASAAKYFKSELSSSVDYSEFTASVPKTEPTSEPTTSAAPSANDVVWVEADGEDGRKYYFHMYTGESIWEQPPSFYTMEEYGRFILSREFANMKQENIVTKMEEVSRTPDEMTERLAEGVPSEAVVGRTAVEINASAEEAVEQRVAVKKEPIEEEAVDVPHELCDIPLPGAASAVPNLTPKEEPPLEPVSELLQPPSEAGTTSAEEVKVEEPAPQEAPHPVQLTEVQQELQQQQQQQQQQQAAPVGPLGSWTKVKKSDSAPVYSPLTARYRAEEERERKAAEERERQAMLGEPAIQFTEKTSGLLTKKVKGPIEFKKRTATKNVRQRTQ